MPFKSKAQQRAMNAKCGRGEIKQAVCNEFNDASKGVKLPERIGKVRRTR